MKNNESYRQRLHSRIPGGAHTYSRGDDQFPENAPAILESGTGAWVTDPEGNEFLDYGMGLRSVTLGYAHPEVNAAVIKEINKGNNLSRATSTELQAAESLLDLFPWADMVKFGKSGSAVTTAAVKLARAFTGRTHVAICADHPFFSFDDWFIQTTPMNKGTSDAGRNTSLNFHYNDPQSLNLLFEKFPNKIACVILEPATFVSPCPSCKDLNVKPDCKNCASAGNNFLHQVKKICHTHGALFILDEMITGFRWDIHGAMKLYDIAPDLATFGKGMANGFPLAALIGKKEIMEMGSILQEGQERVFLISTTHGSEMSAMGAFLKVLEIYKRDHVPNHLWNYGRALINGINQIAHSLQVEAFFRCNGYPCSPIFQTKDAEGSISLEFRTLFLQEMVKNGVLIPYIAISLAHGEKELAHTLDAAKKALTVYKEALGSSVKNYLKGNSIKPVFRKFN